VPVLEEVGIREGRGGSQETEEGGRTMDDGRNIEYRTRNIECRSEKINGAGRRGVICDLRLGNGG